MCEELTDQQLAEIEKRENTFRCGNYHWTHDDKAAEHRTQLLHALKSLKARLPKATGSGETISVESILSEHNPEQIAKFLLAEIVYHQQEKERADTFERLLERMRSGPSEEMLLAARDWSYKKYGKPIGNEAAIGCWNAMLAAMMKGEGK